MVEEKRGEVAWNIVAEQTKFISELLKDATRKYLMGNIKGWYEILTAIRENIDYDLNPKETEELNDIESQAWALQKYWGTHLRAIKEGKVSNKETIKKKKEYITKVRAYSRKLLEILNRLGYFPKKEDRTKLSF